jgi:anthranilate synthase component II
MKILVLDNYDSFTYNLVHMIRVLGYAPKVIRNDKIDGAGAQQFDKIILSPGPGIPDEAGNLKEIIRVCLNSRPILGVCLGHQAIAEVCGGQLRNLDTVYHGLATDIDVDSNEPLFKGMEPKLSVGRYHSWVVDRKNFPDSLRITAADNQGEIMALRHKEYEVCGVQFHPESILTPDGAQIIRNFLNPAL